MLVVDWKKRIDWAPLFVLVGDPEKIVSVPSLNININNNCSISNTNINNTTASITSNTT